MDKWFCEKMKLKIDEMQMKKWLQMLSRTNSECKLENANQKIKNANRKMQIAN